MKGPVMTPDPVAITDRIQSRCPATLAYTPGEFARAQPLPKLTRPIWVCVPLAEVTNSGPRGYSRESKTRETQNNKERSDGAQPNYRWSGVTYHCHPGTRPCHPVVRRRTSGWSGRKPTRKGFRSWENSRPGPGPA